MLVCCNCSFAFKLKATTYPTHDTLRPFFSKPIKATSPTLLSEVSPSPSSAEREHLRSTITFPSTAEQEEQQSINAKPASTSLRGSINSSLASHDPPV
jgi:hypothetical protein